MWIINDFDYLIKVNSWKLLICVKFLVFYSSHIRKSNRYEENHQNTNKNCANMTYFDCMFLSFHVRVSEWIHTL